MSRVVDIDYFERGPDGPGWYLADWDLKWGEVSFLLGPLPTKAACEAEVEALWDRVDRKARGH